MVELVVFFHQIISIIRNNRRAVIFPCLLDNSSKVGNHLNQPLFFFAQFNTSRNLSGNHNTRFGSFTKHRLNTSISILNKRACITIEVDRLFRIKRHIFTRIYFQNEIFQCTQTDDTGNIISFFLCQTIQFAKFL